MDTVNLISWKYSILPDLFQAAGLDGLDIPGNLFFRPVPPFHVPQSGGRIVIKTCPDRACRDAAHDRVRLYVSGNDRAGADDGAVSDGDACKNNGFKSDPYIVSNDYIPFVVPALCNVSLIQFPFFKKERKRISTERSQRMIGAVKKEFCSAGNGAEFSDDEAVLIDGVVV